MKSVINIPFACLFSFVHVLQMLETRSGSVQAHWLCQYEYVFRTGSNVCD